MFLLFIILFIISVYCDANPMVCKSDTRNELIEPFCFPLEYNNITNLSNIYHCETICDPYCYFNKTISKCRNMNYTINNMNYTNNDIDTNDNHSSINYILLNYGDSKLENNCYLTTNSTELSLDISNNCDCKKNIEILFEKYLEMYILSQHQTIVQFIVLKFINQLMMLILLIFIVLSMNVVRNTPD
jgi:hypothetical protein